MANFISKTQYINNVSKDYENNLNSIYARMLQSNPVSVTYYHINNIESTTDSGFLDIQEAIGPQSPLRYMKVASYPLFNIPTVQLDLINDEQGLDVEFEGDAIHLPNTIKPYPNDLFIIDMISKPCIFICTSVTYDTIKSHNYYKMNFSLRHISEDRIKQLERQVTDRYTCVYENIGTEENWLISDDKKVIVNELLGGGSGNSSNGNTSSFGSSSKNNQGLINKLKSLYKTAYYHERTNTFLFAYDYRNFIYDRYVNNFIYTTNIYYNAMSTDALILVNEDVGIEFEYEYEDSFFNAIQSRDIELIKDEYLFRPLMITNKSSIFSFYDMNVCGLRMTFGTEKYLEPVLINCIKGRLPSYPDIPVIPTEPEEPIIPEEPDTPIEPEEPETPTEPIEPDNPDDNSEEIENPDVTEMSYMSVNNSVCCNCPICCCNNSGDGSHDSSSSGNGSGDVTDSNIDIADSPEFILPYKIIRDYLNGNITSLYQLDIESLKKYNFKRYCFENYLLIPVIIFILTKYCKELS